MYNEAMAQTGFETISGTCNSNPTAPWRFSYGLEVVVDYICDQWIMREVSNGSYLHVRAKLAGIVSWTTWDRDHLVLVSVPVAPVRTARMHLLMRRSIYMMPPYELSNVFTSQMVYTPSCFPPTLASASRLTLPIYCLCNLMDNLL